VSVVDPPPRFAEAVSACGGHRLWPVIVGAARLAPLVLAAPGILGDQPQIAPESNATFYDGLVIDEMLTRRVMAMTDAVKPGGRLVYSTCSLFFRENEERAAAFAARHPGWIAEGARRLSPLDGGDGFFFAAFRAPKGR
jgi:hypothetical protein